MGSSEILRSISLEVAQGELLYILGSNGSGKTTLIKTILGIIKPYSGSVNIFGKPNTQEQVSRHIGYVPQYSNVTRDFPISVKEIIELECSTLEHCSVNAHEHLKYFNAEIFKNDRLSELSGGEFQKVLIARAFVSNPKILILDEPFNNLDKQAQQELLRLINKLHKQDGMTILIITHDPNIIKASDQAVLLEDGKLITNKAEMLLKEYLHHES